MDLLFETINRIRNITISNTTKAKLLAKNEANSKMCKNVAYRFDVIKFERLIDPKVR